MGYLSEAIELARDIKFRKLRLGLIKSQSDGTSGDGIVNGQISVEWLDGEVGGQGKIQITYPAFNNASDNPWGMELGLSAGMIGIFGFLQDNHAIFLGTLQSAISNASSGYKKERKAVTGTDQSGNPTHDTGIKSGEFRVRSKQGATVYWDSEGNLITRTYRQTTPPDPNTTPPTPEKEDLRTLAFTSKTTPDGNMTLISYARNGTENCRISMDFFGNVNMTGISNMTQKFGPDATNFTQITTGEQEDDMGTLNPNDPSALENALPITHDVYTTGDIRLRTPNASLIINDQGVHIEAGTNADGSSIAGTPKLTVGGNCPVLYSKKGNSYSTIDNVSEIGVSNTLFVYGDGSEAGDDQVREIEED